MGILSAVIIFLLVVMLHEFGHFTVAKLVGIKVNEFSIGMGPSILNKKSAETKYSLRLLPIGGYVAMEGESEESKDPRAFSSVGVGKRLAVVVAGAFMNFVLAVFAFLILNLISGYPTSTIGNFTDISPARDAGLLAGDKIIQIDGKNVNTWEDITSFIAYKTSNDIELKAMRDGEEIKFNVKLNTIKEEGKAERKVIGIMPKNEFNFIKSITNAFATTGNVISSVYKALWTMLNGGFKTTDLSGPLGVISFIGKQSKEGITPLIATLGLISANLGVMNLLPLSPLDGGKAVFLLIEAIRGKKVNAKIEEKFSLIGFVALFGLMIYVTIFSDLKRIIGW
ncbi:RIP metalloprotease RseP [Peptoniphilus sp. GNH]|nr:RIP metalloprotease RseP [Clostridiales bacterium KA00134]UHR02914.1 RIP metalloprotease RseP [Peptoniphilus sp. GNH]